MALGEVILFIHIKSILLFYHMKFDIPQLLTYSSVTYDFSLQQIEVDVVLKQKV